MALLDATVVNVALPEIGRSLDADLAGLQWTVSGYTLTLASFILLGGALGDRLGRRKMFLIGTAGFAVTSLMCGLAVNIETLVAARVLQGVTGAMLTPGSLALLSTTIDERDQGAAIGLWSGFGGVAGAVGPLFGGWLVTAVGWRAVFLINLPVAAVVLVVGWRHLPESRDENAPQHLDVVGAILVAVGLGTLTYSLIAPSIIAGVVGAVVLGIFVVVEMRSAHPLVPPSLFASRVFTAANLVTFAVYTALGGVFFLLLLQLQLVSGYSPVTAGLATIPITLLMLGLSAWAGRWAQDNGPRIPMTVGPLVAAAGVMLMQRIGPDASYFLDVLPAVFVFGLGLSALVAPLTGAVLRSVPSDEAGIASGVNNAVARTAQLLAVAALPGLSGLASAGFDDPVAFNDGFDIAMLICAGLLIVGAAIAALLLRTPTHAAVPEGVDCKPNCGVIGPAVAPRAGLRQAGAS